MLRDGSRSTLRHGFCQRDAGDPRRRASGVAGSAARRIGAFLRHSTITAMSLHNVTPGANAPDEFNVIIEIPMNADPIKYEVDKETRRACSSTAS